MNSYEEKAARLHEIAPLQAAGMLKAFDSMYADDEVREQKLDAAIKQTEEMDAKEKGEAPPPPAVEEKKSKKSKGSRPQASRPTLPHIRLDENYAAIPHRIVRLMAKIPSPLSIGYCYGP
jgi:hypothetical protein